MNSVDRIDGDLKRKCDVWLLSEVCQTVWRRQRRAILSVAPVVATSRRVFIPSFIILGFIKLFSDFSGLMLNYVIIL
jgi:hypothetical protein